MARTEEEIQALRDRNAKAREELEQTKIDTETKVREAAEEFEIAQLEAEYDRIQAAKRQAEELSKRATANPAGAAVVIAPHGPASPLAPEGAPAPTGAPVHTAPESDGPILPDETDEEKSAREEEALTPEQPADSEVADDKEELPPSASTGFGSGGGVSNFIAPVAPEGK